MNHSLFAALGAIAVAGTMTLSAQTPTPPTPRPQTPSPSPSTPSRTDDKTMTLTGCLKSADGTAGTPSGAASSTATKFLLTDIESDSGSSKTPSATGTTPGTTGTTTPSTTGTTGERAGMSNANAEKQYTLTADAGVNLSAHLNHKVRVTGKLTDTAATSGSTTRPGETSSTADRSSMDKGKTLAVSSVTMISNSCSTTR